nr:syntaxin-8-like isoform X1 [Parasteatoda tepidariorum]
MAFRQDSWMASYNSCESLAREIMEKISYRNQQPKNSVASGKASAQARKLMKKFSDNLSSLKQTLLASKDLLTEGEFERRERLIDGLNNKNTQINDAFSGREEGGNRQALLGAEMVTPSTNVWGMEEDERTRDLSFNEIKEQQLMAIQEQDKGLDTLHDVVVRQKHMAANIGQELDLQNGVHNLCPAGHMRLFRLLTCGPQDLLNALKKIHISFFFFKYYKFSLIKIFNSSLYYSIKCIYFFVLSFCKPPFG